MPWLLLLVLTLASSPQADQAFVPDGGAVAHYTVARARTPIVVDGHLGEFA